MSALTMNPETAEPRSCCFVDEAPGGRHVLKLCNQQARQDGQNQVSTLFIFHRGDAYPGIDRLLARWPHSAVRSVIARLNRFHDGRANPRSLAYMKETINSRIGSLGVEQMNDLSILPRIDFSEIDQIVLLWPDANGMGWFNIERQVFRAKKAGTHVYVLNGRRRLFELPRSLWREYRVRRFLEKSFILEIGVIVLFFITAPVLTLWDMVFEPRRRHG